MPPLHVRWPTPQDAGEPCLHAAMKNALSRLGDAGEKRRLVAHLAVGLVALYASYSNKLG
jgi:hypothetical protein